ncbi:MAG: hypothetical protein ACYSX0_12055 [Planctomycetota bacterium]
MTAFPPAAGAELPMRIVPRSLALALVALAAAGPGSAIAAKKQKTEVKFVISMESPCYDWWSWGIWSCSDWSGKFRASGAVSDRGPASAPELGLEFRIRLDGKKGSITIIVPITDYYDWTAWTSFVIAEGTGVYAGLSGGGSADVDFTPLVDRYQGIYAVGADLDLRGTIAGG